MEAIAKKGLHPLLTVAAISVTVFSAVGVAALTGVLPHSTSKEAAPSALVAPPALVAAPDIAASAAVSPAVEKPADEVAPMPPAAARSTPKPAHKKVAKTPKPAQIAQAPQAAPVPPPPPAPIEAPKPVPAGILGVVESVREVKQPQKTNGSGPILGGIAGAVAGNQVGRGNGQILATILGTVGGAVAGTAVERNVRATSHWEVNVRLDDGSTRTLNSDVAPFWHGGERVRLLDGKLQPA